MGVFRSIRPSATRRSTAAAVTTFVVEPARNRALGSAGRPLSRAWTPELPRQGPPGPPTPAPAAGGAAAGSPREPRSAPLRAGRRRCARSPARSAGRRSGARRERRRGCFCDEGHGRVGSWGCGMCVTILRCCRGDGIVGEEGPAPGPTLSNSRCFQGSCGGGPLGGEKVLSRSPSLRLHARGGTGRKGPRGHAAVARHHRGGAGRRPAGAGRTRRGGGAPGAGEDLVGGGLPLVKNSAGPP